MEINSDYTHADHEHRDEDAYAQLKYSVTLRWLSDLGANKGERLLNVGCGAGDFNALATAAGYAVDGIEPDESALAIAKGRSASGTTLSSESIFDFTPKFPYDIVVMHDVLEHIEDHKAAVERIAFFLNRCPQALFVVSVPAHQWLFGIHDENLGHYRRYSSSSLIKVLSLEFQVVRKKSLGLLGIPAALYFSRLRRKEYPIGKTGIAKKVFDTTCRLEERFNSPIGSSLLVVCRPKSSSPQKSMD